MSDPVETESFRFFILAASFFISFLEAQLLALIFFAPAFLCRYLSSGLNRLSQEHLFFYKVVQGLGWALFLIFVLIFRVFLPRNVFFARGLVTFSVLTATVVLIETRFDTAGSSPDVTHFIRDSS